MDCGLPASADYGGMIVWTTVCLPSPSGLPPSPFRQRRTSRRDPGMMKNRFIEIPSGISYTLKLTMHAASRITKYTMCPYNCWPVNCGLEVTVENGQIVQIRGNPHHDHSQGKLCVKGQCCGDIIKSKERITHPLKRKRGGEWERISWAEALDTIADRMRRNIDDGGSEKNAIYHSHGNIVQRMNFKILTPRFANMLDMTLWDGNFPCWYDVGVAQRLSGYTGRHDPAQAGEHASALVNWAQDPCASQSNLVPFINMMRDRGAPVVTIDPRVTQTAALSDIHIRPRVGTDVWLANAVARLLVKSGKYDRDFVEKYTSGFNRYAEHVDAFTPEKAADECGISVKEIETLAGIYAAKKPLCLNLTRGALGKHTNGIQMVRAIVCLSALCGNLGRRGGGIVWGESIEFNNDLAAEESRQDAGHFPNNFNSIDQALESGAIDTFLVVGGNPLSQWPDVNRLEKQLAAVGLVVVNDLFLTYTARASGDIFLPATSWLEESGLRASHRRVYLMDRILEPAGESRRASDWMNYLTKKLGVKDYFPWKNMDECLDACLDSDSCAGITVERLKDTPGGIEARIQAVPYSDMKFDTESGSFEFYSTKAESLGLPPLPVYEKAVEGIFSTPDLACRYPLQLISSRRNTHFHSFHDHHRSISTLNHLEPGPVLFVHPADAAARNIKDADMIFMFNNRGRSMVRCELTTEVMPGHVSLNDAWSELNMLTRVYAPCPVEVTRSLNMGGQPSYQNCLVEIEKA